MVDAGGGGRALGGRVRRRTAAPGCTACRRGWCCRSRSRRATVPSGRREDGPLPTSQPVDRVGGDGGVAVVVLRVEEVHVGAVVVAVGLADLATGRGVVAAVVPQRVDGRAGVADGCGSGSLRRRGSRGRGGGASSGQSTRQCQEENERSEKQYHCPRSPIYVNGQSSGSPFLDGSRNREPHDHWEIRRSHPRMARQAFRRNTRIPSIHRVFGA